MEDLLLEMANLRKRRTGLPFNIWISDTPNQRHGARIKVQQNYADSVQADNTASVILAQPIRLANGSRWQLGSSDWQVLAQFVESNFEALEATYWGDLDVVDFLDVMVRYV